MRHLAYGILSSSAIFAEATEATGGPYLLTLAEAVRNYTLKGRILAIFPSCLFISAGEKKTHLQERLGNRGVLIPGAVVCAVLAIVPTCLLLILINML